MERLPVSAGCFGNVCDVIQSFKVPTVNITGETEDCHVVEVQQNWLTQEECDQLACETSANTVSYVNASDGCSLFNCSSDVIITGANDVITGNRQSCMVHQDVH